jgi:hypothetical protein
VAVPRAAGTSIQKPESASKPSNSRRAATTTPIAVGKGASKPHNAGGRPDSDGEGFQLVRRGKKKKRRKTLASKGLYDTHISAGCHRTSSHDETMTGSSSRSNQKGQASWAVLTNCLIRDSIVKKVGPYFTASNPSNRVIGFFPVAGMVRLTKAISNLRLEQGSSLIVTGCGNDLFLQKGRTGDTEPVIFMFEDMVGKV